MTPRQHGLILPALLVLLLIGSLAAVLGSGTLARNVETRRQAHTMAALAQARAALIGYAQSYHLTHAGQSVGYLPCPDTDSSSGDGNAAPVCGSQDNFAIGRLPYRTLGLPPLRDGEGECLWYAVAGAFKNNPKSDRLDWDSAGQFQIRDGQRNLIAVAFPDQWAAAVVFAPSRPLAGQLRSSSARRCSGDADAAAALQAYLEGATTAPSALTPVLLMRGQPDGTANNDRLAWISADDIFDAHLVARSDFASLIDGINTGLRTTFTQMATSPVPHLAPAPSDASATGVVDIGGLPAPYSAAALERPLTPDESAVNGALAAAAPWRDQYRYLRCGDGSACLDWDDGSGITKPCSAIIAFAGHRLPDQNRADGIAADPAAFFEGPNVQALALAAPFTGLASYAGSQPTVDVIQCVP
ncbi:hypothetical protein [Denitromonas iodatirespirans]|uniref:Type II secretion system protein n=1 Tax=Denitromonas iodatirespirans TaxID=2795389 RepID=A0A944DC21_DENI1|nr:hypothetical protein [Denitromonas iodatirespirans]MBT0962682.1 hypothetical protein [Denitromonas iodatirespirans]